MEAMLTVRLDAEIKQRGTQAMNKMGITPSQAVRKLFDYAATHEVLPFETSKKPSKEDVQNRIEAFDRCHTKVPITMTDEELRELRLRDRYDFDA